MNEKLSLLKQLIILAQADNKVNNQEYNFILRIAKMLLVSQEELDSLFEKQIEYSPPKSEFERIVQFYRLVLLANVDLHLADEELEMMRNAGLYLGLHAQAMEEIFIRMRKNEKGIVPEEELINVFKTSYN